MNNEVEKIKCDLEKLEEKLDKIMSNHLPHIQIEMEKMNTNLTWLLRFFWLVISASIGALLTSILGLILK